MSEASALVALDTNILIYAEGIAQHSRDTHKPAIARRLIAALPPPSVVIPAQVLGELYRVLVGKAGRTPTAARETLMMWRDGFAIQDTTAATVMAGVDLAAAHGLSIWDAIIISAAAGAGCRFVLSEDMHDGFDCRGLTVVNPFSDRPHPLLAALMEA